MSAAVEVHDLFRLHPTPSGSVAALRGMTLRVEEGERLVVHGPNGSGKSTLLGVLAAEVAPSSGSVRVAGVDLAGADERTRAHCAATCSGWSTSARATRCAPSSTSPTTSHCS